MFITFEGLDLSGKSTQAELLAQRLTREGYNVLFVREPGGTEIGEKIRSILLDNRTEGMSEITEVFLFSASRAQLVLDVIRPALDAGTIVVCDRFYDSTTAYQGWGRQIPLDAIEAINRTATGGLAPALTVFLDVSLDKLERRMKVRRAGKDRMELNGRPFYERVRNGYLAIAGREKRVLVVDGMQSVEDLEQQIWRQVEPRLARKTQS
ncbi:MAG TPA: dTMP kinase [Bacteroidota bacterium]